MTRWLADVAACFVAAVSLVVLVWGTNPWGVFAALVLTVGSVLFLCRRVAHALDDIDGVQ